MPCGAWALQPLTASRSVTRPIALTAPLVPHECPTRGLVGVDCAPLDLVLSRSRNESPCGISNLPNEALKPILRHWIAEIIVMHAVLNRCSRSGRPAPSVALAWVRWKSAQAFESSSKAPALPPCDYTPPVYSGPSKDEVYALRKQYMNPGACNLVSAGVACYAANLQHVHAGRGSNRLPPAVVNAPLPLTPQPPHPPLVRSPPTPLLPALLPTPLPAIFHLYKDPVMIVNGHMQYLFDEKGQRYLDVSAAAAGSPSTRARLPPTCPPPRLRRRRSPG